MRTESKIRHQLRQVTFRHLQKRLKANFKKLPSTCASNREVELDEGTSVFLCGVVNGDGTMRGVPCDARIPGCKTMARECSLWTPLFGKDEVKAEFADIMESGDRGVIAAEFPDIAALLWVLDDDTALPTSEEIDNAAAEAEPEASWWGPRWLKKLGGGE